MKYLMECIIELTWNSDFKVKYTYTLSKYRLIENWKKNYKKQIFM